MKQVKTLIKNYLAAVDEAYSDCTRKDTMLREVSPERMEAIVSPMLTDWGIRNAVRAVQEEYLSAVYESMHENCLGSIRPVGELTGEELDGIRDYVVGHIGDGHAFFFENLLDVSVADFYLHFEHEMMFEMKEAVSNACSALRVKLTAS